MKKFIATVLIIGLIQYHAHSQEKHLDELRNLINTSFPQLERIYKDLHANPELSLQEAYTSKRLSAELTKIGISVTSNIGGYGIVGLLSNGEGPTIMIRTDMDALPIQEETGLSYASRIRMKDKNGVETAVMHACGHDFHMSTWLGVAKVLMQMKSKWKGTIVFVGQPAEEIGVGARAMIADGLFDRFPRPNYALALHVNPSLKAGTIGYCSGYALANVDNISIRVKGKGGHGASPHTAIDPIVISSRIVLGLQTIISREVSPIQSPSVITVGSIHGGTTGNIIPNEVEMKLTVRSFGKENREFLINRIKATTEGVAFASGLEKSDFPEVNVNNQYTPSVYNSPELTNLLSQELGKILGTENIVSLKQEMVGEDFGNYTMVEPRIPTLIYSVGTSEEPSTIDGSVFNFPVHSSKFSPVLDPSLKTAVLSMAYSVLVLLEKNK
ncbi:M20 metallopeptidase family protein [Sphingobacterium hotanense]|uniref:M20 metallopeptidase family protein n=1 Tax=Sphingobacterium hotanense TaxID=649196 RepID=UPI0021A97121|nr:amidohydrolase [Sphingobacterium hotanense]MCT1523584.1 amidohydrolase [Sphingobacterium hotanense]